MPMGMAEIAVALWAKHYRHNPANPQWSNRDRFVLSNGHGSMLHYALLHLTGYDLSMDEIRNFRQLHSKTAGHPEVHITPGIETTTGPLGHGRDQRGRHGDWQKNCWQRNSTSLIWQWSITTLTRSSATVA